MIKQNYGSGVLKIFYETIDNQNQLEKNKFDFVFLTTCKMYDAFSKFLGFINLEYFFLYFFY